MHNCATSVTAATLLQSKAFKHRFQWEELGANAVWHRGQVAIENNCSRPVVSNLFDTMGSLEDF